MNFVFQIMCVFDTLTQLLVWSFVPELHRTQFAAQTEG